MKSGSLLALLVLFFCSCEAGAAEPVARNQAASQYLHLLEIFAGWADQHWNEKEESFDAAGAGVTWPRGNGGVCLVYAVLLTEFPERTEFSPRKVPRDRMLSHVQRTLRTLCLRNKNCTSANAQRPTWGGPSWQSALETEHWVFAARLLESKLDDETKALVRQVATHEADLCKKKIPSAKKGNTGADDCCWNAGLLGVTAAFYADDPRAVEWDEWAKRWALNTESRDTDRKSERMVDGKPLGEWLVSTNVFPDLTLENHGFWDLPYQVSFAALSEPIMAYHIAGKKIPESFYLNAREEGENILKWMTLADGDLLCPQGLDWAERDVQHSWCFTELGTLCDLPWARAAEVRCLKLLLQRQDKFGDGALHANDFGYETDLANCWCFSFLLQKYFGKADSETTFEEPRGAKSFPHVSVGVSRTSQLVSSVTWYGPRQAVMIVPNDAAALGEHPSFTAYRCNLAERQVSGLGHLLLKGETKPRAFKVAGEPTITENENGLSVSFNRVIPGIASQQIGYCALNTGEVIVFSRRQALADVQVAELADHPFYWIEIKGWLPERAARSIGDKTWSIDGKLRMQVLGGSDGRLAQTSVIGSARDNFTAKANEIMQECVCVYQAELPGKAPLVASGNARRVEIGEWIVERKDDGQVIVSRRR